jgi:hypothetical protein
MTAQRLGQSLRRHVLGALAVFIALGGTAIAATGPSGDRPEASASAVSDKKFKNLKRRVAALERPQAAGGALAGQYPNPSIRPGAVGAAEIANGGVGADQIAPGAVGATQIAPGAVGATQIAPGAVGTAQIASGAVTRAKFQANLTVPIDFGSINPGTCFVAAFAAAGVEPGDAALLAPPTTTPPTVITQAVVTGVDAMVIKACNVAVVAADPPAGDYLISIIR